MTPDVQHIEHAGRSNARAVAFPPDRILCRVLGMFKMFCPSNDYALAPHLAFDGYWESWVTAAFWRLLRPGMHVVNVGANVGYYTMLAAKMVGAEGRVDAFEPNPVLFRLLQDNVAVNGFSAWCKTWNLAVADQCKDVAFNCPPTHPMNGSIVLGDGACDVTTVRADTLDRVLDHRPDVIFCDAEGAEPLMIDGAQNIIARTAFGPTLVLEWSPKRYRNAKTSAKVLLDLGYRVWLITGDGGESAMQPDAFIDSPEEIMIVCRRHPGGA